MKIILWGQVMEFGPVDVKQEEIIEFAQKYDPQYFHIDPQKAKHSIYGGLIASGWHTASMVMRLMVEHYLSPKASLGSPGIDELRWLKPVYPGNQLHVRTTVLDCKRSRSKNGSWYHHHSDRGLEPGKGTGDEFQGNQFHAEQSRSSMTLRLHQVSATA